MIYGTWGWKKSSIYEHAKNIFEAEERRKDGEELLFWILHKILELHLICFSANFVSATSAIVLCLYSFV